MIGCLLRVLTLVCVFGWVNRDEEAVKVVMDGKLDCKQAAEELRDMAYKKGSFDNITVMVIRPAR